MGLVHPCDLRQRPSPQRLVGRHQEAGAGAPLRIPVGVVELSPEDQRQTPFSPGELRVRIGGGTREPLPFMVRTADGSRVLGVQGGSVVYADKLSGVTIISGDAAEVVVKLGP